MGFFRGQPQFSSDNYFSITVLLTGAFHGSLFNSRPDLREFAATRLDFSVVPRNILGLIGSRIGSACLRLQLAHVVGINFQRLLPWHVEGFLFDKGVLDVLRLRSLRKDGTVVKGALS
jgi:hypothetical protein